MVRRVKSQESEICSSATNQHTELEQSSQHHHPTSNTKHPRQFSTRSRAKSTASFKGLRRALGHDISKSMDKLHHHQQHHHSSNNPIARIKSADSLYRRRTLSALNMTSLGMPGSHANHLTQSTHPNGSRPHSRSNSFGYTGVGIRPRRTKSTHSVLQYNKEQTKNTLNNIDDLSSEEEVDYFTDEELSPSEDSASKNATSSENLDQDMNTNRIHAIDTIPTTTNNTVVPKPLSKKPQFTLGNDHDKLDNSIQSGDSDEEESSLKKESKDVDNNESHLDTFKTIKEDNLNKLKKVQEYRNSSENVSIDGEKLSKHENNTKVDNINIASDHITSHHNQIIRQHSEDHIGNAESVDTVTSNELTRQERNQKHSLPNFKDTDHIEYDLQENKSTTTQKDLLINNENPDRKNYINKFNLIDSPSKDNFGESKIERNHQNQSLDNSLTGQYIPNMILSQSTGIERTFEHPTSIQNSLSNEFRTNTTSNKDDTNNDKNINTDIPFMYSDRKNIDTHSGDKAITNKVEQPNIIVRENSRVIENSHQKESDRQSNIKKSPQQTESKNKRNSFSNSFSSLTNNLQRANAAASLAMTANAENHSSKLKPKKSTTSIINENSSKHSSYISTIFNRRPNSRQQQYLKQERRGSLEKNAPSLLSQLSSSNRRTSITGNKINMDDNFSNFSQFLKTDNTNDGDLRTQRKLWLQRENSIMDLNLQKDGNADSIFMATNVDVKREFERISHEYTSLRRFYNTIDAALTRFESNKDRIQSTVGKTSTNANIKSQSRKPPSSNEIAQSLASQGDNMLNAFISGRSVTSKASDSNPKADDFFGNTQNSKLQRILTTMWNQESANFNNEVNPLSAKNSSRTAVNESTANINPDLRQTHHNNTAHHSSILAARHSLRTAVGSSTNFYRQ